MKIKFKVFREKQILLPLFEIHKKKKLETDFFLPISTSDQGKTIESVK